MPKCCIGPQQAFGGHTLTSLPEIHADDGAEKVLELFRVSVVRGPAGSCERNALHDEGGYVHDGDVVQARREKSGNVLFVSEK